MKIINNALPLKGVPKENDLTSKANQVLRSLRELSNSTDDQVCVAGNITERLAPGCVLSRRDDTTYSYMPSKYSGYFESGLIPINHDRRLTFSYQDCQFFYIVPKVFKFSRCIGNCEGYSGQDHSVLIISPSSDRVIVGFHDDERVYNRDVCKSQLGIGWRQTPMDLYDFKQQGGSTKVSLKSGYESILAKGSSPFTKGSISFNSTSLIFTANESDPKSTRVYPWTYEEFGWGVRSGLGDQCNVETVTFNQQCPSPTSGSISPTPLGRTSGSLTNGSINVSGSISPTSLGRTSDSSTSGSINALAAIAIIVGASCVLGIAVLCCLKILKPYRSSQSRLNSASPVSDNSRKSNELARLQVDKLIKV